MSEVRRHSVDIPISRALVALMRVRSLRDPDTSSLSKVPSIVNEMDFETSSCNSASFGTSTSKLFRWQSDSWQWYRRKKFLEKIDSDSGLSALKLPSMHTASTRFTVNDSIVHQSCANSMSKFSESSRIFQYANSLDDEISKHNVACEHVEKNSASDFEKSIYGCSESPCSIRSDQMSHSRVICKHTHKNRNILKSSEISNDEVDLMLSCGNNCGCLPEVQRYPDSELPSNAECQECRCCLKRETVCHATAPCLCKPSTLSEKYRPRSFNQLVGQNVIVHSFLNAINNEKISPVYLFYGPSGTGKTSVARIFAAALNCSSYKQHRPCGSCHQCIFTFSGRSKNVIELNASEAIEIDMENLLAHHAYVVPASSFYTVFIIDDCHLMQKSAWATIRDNLEELSQHVFVMITSEMDKLPRDASWCQKYRFSNIKDTDIITMVEKICREEGISFENDALELISRKSSGSLHDAVVMLDQLSLLGRGITTSLVSELTGTVSDDELLSLLHLALSSNISGTVRKARELMSSRIDPMQLTTQLANMIMDIISGRCQLQLSRAIADLGMNKLKHALQILSETEKQLRTSKSQPTWLIAALLQLNNAESLSLPDMNNLVACPRLGYLQDDGLAAAASTNNDSTYSQVLDRDLQNSEVYYIQAKELEIIWRKIIENCQSSSLKRFLRKEGRLSSINENEGTTVAEIVFSHPDHVTRAENSLHLIAQSLQDVYGCSMNVRISLVPTLECQKVKRKSSFNFLSCFRRKQENFSSLVGDVSGTKENSCGGYTPHLRKNFLPAAQQLLAQDKSSISILDEEVTTTIAERSTLATGDTKSACLVQDNLPIVGLSGSLKEAQTSSQERLTESEDKSTSPGCISKTQSISPNAAYQQHSKLQSPDIKKTPVRVYLCGKMSCFFCPRSNEEVACIPEDMNRPRKVSKCSLKSICCRDSTSIKRGAFCCCAWRRGHTKSIKDISVC